MLEDLALEVTRGRMVDNFGRRRSDNGCAATRGVDCEPICERTQHARTRHVLLHHCECLAKLE